MSVACSALATGWPGIAVPLGLAHFPSGGITINKDEGIPHPLQPAAQHPMFSHELRMPTLSLSYLLIGSAHYLDRCAFDYARNTFYLWQLCM